MKENGLVHACLLDGRGGFSSITRPQLDAWEPEQGALWLHFNLEEPESQSWLSESSGLEEVVVDALLEVESRPRLTPVGAGALLAFRGVNLNDGAEPDDMIGIRIWLEKDRVITSFRRHLRSVDDLVGELENSNGPDSAAGIVTTLATRLVARMSETVDNLEEVIASLEEQLLDGRPAEIRQQLSGVRRQVIALRRYLAPQREALSALISCKFSWINDELRLELRETSDKLARHLEDLDAIRERAAVTQEELQSRLAEQQNLRMYVLSIVAAIFLPLGFLTGLLGINVGGIPGSDNPAAFAVFAGLLFLIVLAQVVYFRMRKWF